MDRFGRYSVFECLGTGGMASVHRATTEIGGGVVREVALKRMLPQLADDKKTLDDFIREAKLAAQLDHPNIVRILELGRAGTTYFIAMELVRGASLLQLMKLMVARNGVAPVGIVVAILCELCEALEYASHAIDAEGEPMEIVHRDLSPSNLIISDEGHLKIIDFGVAKTTAGKFMTSSGLVKGKLGYMALEVLAGKQVDRRADIFSVGVVAWELLCGRRLFTGVNEYDVVMQIRKGAKQPPSTHNPEVSPELDEIVMHALSRRRDERWPSGGVMKRALDTLRRSYPHGPREVDAWRRSLVPDPVTEDSTTMELQSLRDIVVRDSIDSMLEIHSEITRTSRTTLIRRAGVVVNADEEDSDMTEMTQMPEMSSSRHTDLEVASRESILTDAEATPIPTDADVLPLPPTEPEQAALAYTEPETPVLQHDDD